MVLINSRDQRLSVYHHPAFGKRLIKKHIPANPAGSKLAEVPKMALTPISDMVDFIKGFHNADV